VQERCSSNGFKPCILCPSSSGSFIAGTCGAASQNQNSAADLHDAMRVLLTCFQHVTSLSVGPGICSSRHTLQDIINAETELLASIGTHTNMYAIIIEKQMQVWQRTDSKAYLPGRHMPCCMYCTAHRGQARSPAEAAVHAGLLVVYAMDLEISSPRPSSAYAAQSVWSLESGRTDVCFGIPLAMMPYSVHQEVVSCAF